MPVAGWITIIVILVIIVLYLSFKYKWFRDLIDAIGELFD